MAKVPGAARMGTGPAVCVRVRVAGTPPNPHKTRPSGVEEHDRVEREHLSSERCPRLNRKGVEAAAAGCPRHMCATTVLGW